MQNRQLNCIRILQKRAIQYIVGAHYLDSVVPLAKSLNLLMIDDLIFMHKCTFMFKNKCWYVAQSLFSPIALIHRFNTRQRNVNFMDTCSNLSLRKQFIVNSGVAVWNALPNNVKSASNIKKFKSLVYDEIIKRESIDFIIY